MGDYQPRSRTAQRFGGAVIAVLGIAGTIWIWNSALDEGKFSFKGSMLMPGAFILGIGMILFPNYKDERVARGEDISKLSGFELITPRWWIVVVVALAAGAVNFALLKYGW